MFFLKQATASQAVLLGPFVDSTDGVTAETGLTIANTDIRLSANGGNMAAKNSGGGTHDENGWYTITLDATDTATVGRLQVSCVVSGALPVFAEFQVLEEAIYDALIGASAAGFDSNGRVDVGSWLGTAVTTSATTSKPEVDVNSISDDATAANNCELMFDGTGYGGGTTLLQVDAKAISASTTAADNVEANIGNLDASIAGLNDPTAAAIADAVWDEDATGHQTTGTFGQAIGDPGANTETIYKAIVSDAAGTNIAADVATVDSNVDAILVDTGTTLPGTLSTIDTNVSAILTDTGTTLPATLSTIDTNVDSILADTGTDGVVVASLSTSAIDSILDEPITEPSGVFAWGSATLRNIVGWMGALSRNKVTETSTTQTLRNDADSANIATSTVSDDGTTYTRGEFS